MLPLYHLPSDTKTIQHSHNDCEIAVLELPHLKGLIFYIIVYHTSTSEVPQIFDFILLNWQFFFTDFCLIFGYQSVSNFPQKP